MSVHLSAFVFIACAIASAASLVRAADASAAERAIASPDLATALKQAPALAAARARAEAARARLESAGRLPDPELEGMVSRRSTTDDVMPMWELSVRQPLPRAGERGADRDRAYAALAMAEAEFALMAGEMSADVAMALAEAETARRRSETLTAQIARTGQVLEAIDARIATGQARLGDRLALQTRVAAMQLMLEQDNRMAADALSEVRARLGLAPEAPLPTFAAPLPGEIVPERAPALVLARARNAEATAMGRMARASANPMTAVGLRFEREAEEIGNNDTVGIAFMTELPWRARRYARAEARAAEAESAATLADADAARHRIAAALGRVERAERLAEVARRLSEETQQRLNADYETLVRAAGTSGMGSESSVLMILEVLEKSTDAQLQLIDAENAVRAARAELWRYVPADAFLAG